MILISLSTQSVTEYKEYFLRYYIGDPFNSYTAIKDFQLTLLSIWLARNLPALTRNLK